MTGRRARDGDVIEPLGMSVEAYLRNPVVLWAHDAIGASPSGGLPIARTVSLERMPEGLSAEFEWLEGDAFAQRVRNAWERGFINAASIGWTTQAWEPLPGGQGRRHTRTELVEWSLVPVPADEGASRGGYAEAIRGLGLEPLALAGPHPSSGDAFGRPLLQRGEGEDGGLEEAARALTEAVRRTRGRFREEGLTRLQTMPSDDLSSREVREKTAGGMEHRRNRNA
jgi:HK97 family phage prohead protease